MNTAQANSLVRGLVFAVQKTRSDMMETLGTDDLAQTMLADMQPWLFGKNAMLPKLVEWQERCKATGIISGSDLFNFTKLIDMQSRPTLGLLGLYGYTTVPLEGPPMEWFTQTWPYLTDGLS